MDLISDYKAKLEVLKTRLENDELKSVDPQLVFDKDANTPLMVACQLFPEYIDVLLEHDADPNVKNVHKWSSLSFAAKYGNPKIIEKLIKHKADPNLDNCANPLLLACQHKPDNIKVLLDCGANIVSGNFGTVFHLISDVKYVQEFIDRGVDLTVLDQNGNNALVNKPAEYIKELVKHGADLNNKNKQGLTALDIAIIAKNDEKQKLENVKELVKLGADIINKNFLLYLVSIMTGDFEKN